MIVTSTYVQRTYEKIKSNKFNDRFSPCKILSDFYTKEENISELALNSGYLIKFKHCLHCHTLQFMKTCFFFN